MNAVCPGIIFTDLMHRGRADEADQTIEKIQPLPMRGEPEHIASMVRFLASDESAFVTGTTQVVDGGYLANGPLGIHPLPGVSNRPAYAGMNYGTTGRGNEITYLESKETTSEPSGVANSTAQRLRRRSSSAPARQGNRRRDRPSMRRRRGSRRRRRPG